MGSTHATMAPPRTRATAAVLAIVVVAGLVGCSAAKPAVWAPVRALLQTQADALVGLPVVAQRTRVQTLLDELRAASAAAYDEAQRARAAIEADPVGQEALGDACGVAVDAVTGQLPTDAEEAVAYLIEVAQVQSEAQSIVDDARSYLQAIEAWRGGAVGEAQLQLATLLFEETYC